MTRMDQFELYEALDRFCGEFECSEDCKKCYYLVESLSQGYAQCPLTLACRMLYDYLYRHDEYLKNVGLS